MAVDDASNDMYVIITNLYGECSLHREYLTGFRKRKKERQVQYKEKLEDKLKNEKKEFRKETKEFLSKAHLEPDAAPEVESFVEPTVVDLPKHTVTITDIAEIDFSGGCGLRLGQNMSLADKTDDYLTQMKEDQKRDIKEINKHKNAMKKRMEHIKLLEEKHKMISNKMEHKGGKLKKKRKGGRRRQKKGDKNKKGRKSKKS